MNEGTVSERSSCPPAGESPGIISLRLHCPSLRIVEVSFGRSFVRVLVGFSLKFVTNGGAHVCEGEGSSEYSHPAALDDGPSAEIARK